LPDVGNLLPLITGAGGVLATGSAEVIRLRRQVPRAESVDWDETCRKQRDLLSLIAMVRWDEGDPGATASGSLPLGDPDPEAGVRALHQALRSSGMRLALLPIRQGARGIWSCEQVVRSYRRRVKKRASRAQSRDGAVGAVELSLRERRLLAQARSQLIAISYVEPAAAKAPRAKQVPGTPRPRRAPPDGPMV